MRFIFGSSLYVPLPARGDRHGSLQCVRFQNPLNFSWISVGFLEISGFQQDFLAVILCNCGEFRCARHLQLPLDSIHASYTEINPLRWVQGHVPCSLISSSYFHRDLRGCAVHRLLTDAEASAEAELGSSQCEMSYFVCKDFQSYAFLIIEPCVREHIANRVANYTFSFPFILRYAFLMASPPPPTHTGAQI